MVGGSVEAKQYTGKHKNTRNIIPVEIQLPGSKYARRMLRQTRLIELQSVVLKLKPLEASVN